MIERRYTGPKPKTEMPAGAVDYKTLAMVLIIYA